ncbi:hypothetical protein BZARG_591 [Bizionia argentinensis JUB59]|uniref:Cell wall anchor protein n=1 Tax=Bizionia argentinensis JUB59 TaxID=1046627 RepID=G2EHK3_9FLAO|nr:hypothetical protein [Bizionia argentinensis]EGV42200.1 hypothetical protein BZARG_591 [Bizionia argentinensis JUB59]
MKAKKILLNICGLIAVMLLTATTYAQVGIGTITPDPSAMLDVQSTTQGLLAPRMTTLERDAITAPAESLLVFDTTEKAFYFYNTASSTWIKLANDASVKRNNYKLIKSVADLAQESIDGGATGYLLDTNTYYEINGTINLIKPINLNNAYVSGMDASEDVLSSTGVVFKGNSGGSIRNVTLKGTKAFEITGPGIATNSFLFVQNTIIDGMNSVGAISGFGLYFANIVQFLNNANGITYSNIGNLLLNNQGWFANNNGTFETFSGAFGLIEKVSGFSSVDGADIALDVSSNPNVSTGILQGTVFSGTPPATGYIKGYTIGTYLDFNFNNAWTVGAPGIPRENDDVATGNLYYDEANTPNVLTVSNTTPFKLPVNTIATSLFRTAKGTGAGNENRLIYRGETRRPINIFAAISFTTTSGTRFAFSIYKNGSKVTGTEAVVDVTDINRRHSVTVIGTVNVVKNDYIEIYVRNTNSGSEQILITSYNLIVN